MSYSALERLQENTRGRFPQESRGVRGSGHINHPLLSDSLDISVADPPPPPLTKARI